MLEYIENYFYTQLKIIFSLSIEMFHVPVTIHICYKRGLTPYRFLLIISKHETKLG